jgi:nucleoside-diphosphate-sugar epimerase
MALMQDRRGGAPRVLVTGAAGYIGTIMMGELAARGYDAVGLDTGFYDAESLYHDSSDRPPLLMRDTRDIGVDDLKGYDIVVHLAELSNDPLCAFNSHHTYDINYRGTVSVASKAKAAGVRRFIYASSCSVYGAAGGDRLVTEEDEPNPQTAYARCKLMVEQAIGTLTAPDFTPVFLRNATAFGASPSMRFDIVLNDLCGRAWTEQRIVMTSDGTPWRPLVHVRDICGAMIAAMEADTKIVSGECFNVGSDDQNYRVSDIAEIVAAEFPGCGLVFGKNDSDNRSYRVSFAKIRERLPAFRCLWDAPRGAREIRQVCERIAMRKETFESPTFTRLRRIRDLIDSGQIDETLRWRSMKTPAARAEAPMSWAV